MVGPVRPAAALLGGVGGVRESVGDGTRGALAYGGSSGGAAPGTCGSGETHGVLARREVRGGGGGIGRRLGPLVGGGTPRPVAALLESVEHVRKVASAVWREVVGAGTRGALVCEEARGGAAIGKFAPREKRVPPPRDAPTPTQQVAVLLEGFEETREAVGVETHRVLVCGEGRGGGVVGKLAPRVKRASPPRDAPSPWGSSASNLEARAAARVAPVEHAEGGGVVRRLGLLARDGARPAAALPEGVEDSREGAIAKTRGILARGEGRGAGAAGRSPGVGARMGAGDAQVLATRRSAPPTRGAWWQSGLGLVAVRVGGAPCLRS